jgi:hypothetical protein
MTRLFCCVRSRPLLAQSVSAALASLRLLSNEQRTQRGDILWGR